MGNDEWEAKMERARRLHRPSLKNWQRDCLHESFPPFAKELELQDNYQSFFVEPDSEYAKKHKAQPVPAVLDAATLTKEAFYKYEAACIPCVIQNIVAGYDGGRQTTPWPAQEKWRFESLADDATLLKRRFKCGEDNDERNIKVTLDHFISYTTNNRDDSPLYIFDSYFDDDEIANSILRDYKVPSYFKEDLFGLVSESRRPPYRWWLVGPKRSGTCVHLDPLATNAWNTLVEGKKRWVLFPPHVPKSVVKGKGLVRDDEDDESIHYFKTILPRIKRKAHMLRETEKYKDFCCYEFTQNPGDTVFVPHGWWHAVLNLTDTVAITQNFCSPRNFDEVWLQTRTGRKRMAWKWLSQLESTYPELAKRAKEANARDGFVMKYDPVEIERREEEDRKRKEAKKKRKEESKQRGTTPKLEHKKSFKRRRRHSHVIFAEA